MLVSGKTNNLSSALYGLVSANGTGGLSYALSEGDFNSTDVITCIWRAVPQLVTVQMVGFVASQLALQDSPLYPISVGRAILNSVHGMAEATSLGASLAHNWGDNDDKGNKANISSTLQILLADAVKVSQVLVITDPNFEHYATKCYSNNRTVQIHWRFGNQYQLGWVAVTLQCGIGMFCYYEMWRLRRKPRLRSFKTLDPTASFLLGRASDIPEFEGFSFEEQKEILLIAGDDMVRACIWYNDTY